jgi:hypothetical protein
VNVPPSSRLRSTIAAATFLFACSSDVLAQAFLPPAGEGSVTFSYQNLLAIGHLDLNGDRMEGDSGHDPTQGHAIVMEADYGLTDRLAVSGSIPFIRSRYEGDHPHVVLGVGPVQEWDDGEYHGTFQDFRIGVRYNVLRRPVAVTAFAEMIIPSHHYPSNAHAAVGKDLRAYLIGGAAGGFLDAFLPRLYFHTAVSYARVQEAVGIRPNRSRMEGELGYFFTPRLSVRFLESYQYTHQGIDLLSFTPMTRGVIHGTDIPIAGEYRRNHDRLQRSNFLTFGGGVAFALNDTFGVYVDAAKMAWGENVHPLRVITVGVNAQFRTRRAAGTDSSSLAAR